MLKVIEQKAKGEPISAPAPRKPARVVSLMDALQQSLATPRRPPAKTAARRTGRRVAKRVA
jgi:non-homologous end joining protein Ku